jgi:hypothetical protein
MTAAHSYRGAAKVTGRSVIKLSLSAVLKGISLWEVRPWSHLL